MIEALTGQSFRARLVGYDIGRSTFLSVKVIDSNNDSVVIPEQNGVSESAAAPGNYNSPWMVAPSYASNSLLIIWTDTETGDTFEEELIISEDVPSAPPGITPTLAEVGSLLRTRTRNSGGTELGTFTDDTRPTGSEVQNLIFSSVSEVQDSIGTADVPPQVEQAVKNTIILYTAMQIELTYFPEQVGSGKSPYNEYKGLYDERLPRLVKAVERAEAGDTGPSSDILPLYNFPDQAPDIVHKASSLGSQGDPSWTDWVQGGDDRPSGGLIGFNTNF